MEGSAHGLAPVRKSASNQPAVRAELAAVLASEVFARPERLRRFLQFIVEETLAERHINEYRIAVEVYDRKASFDPVADSIVRVEVSRLRQRLAEYYRAEGRDRPMMIDLPPRTYVPVFRSRSGPALELPAPPESKVAATPAARAFLTVSRRTAVFTGAVLVVLAVGALTAVALGPRLRSTFVRRPGAGKDGKVSVAVLSFADLSRAKDQAYFADGLTEEITDTLSRISGLNVISRTSAFSYRGKDADIRRIGKELDASAILEGSVRAENGRLRITAQLIDVESGYHLWSETFDRSMHDPFAVEQDIAAGIATALRQHLDQREPAGGARHVPTLQTYGIYLEGIHFARQWSAESLGKAVESFERAVAADPGFAAAWAELAETRTVLAVHAGFPPGSVMPRAKADALKALELDETLPLAHAALGLVAGLYEWRWEEARNELVRAHDLAPSDADVHEAYIMGYLVPTSQLDEALRQAKEAVRYDPVSPRINSVAAMVHSFRGEPDEALAFLRKTLDIDPHFYAARLAMGSVYAAKGMYPQAVEEIRTGRAAWESGVGRSALACLYARMGKRDEARALLNELVALSKQRYISGTYMAQIYLSLGDRAAALDWLEKAYEERSSGLAMLRVSPRFQSLRSDSRFIALLQKIGLA